MTDSVTIKLRGKLSILGKVFLAFVISELRTYFRKRPTSVFGNITLVPKGSQGESLLYLQASFDLDLSLLPTGHFSPR